MRHPSNRAERRHERQRVISRRKFIHDHIWHRDQFHTDPSVNVRSWPPFCEWGRYSKFNLGCGCKGCHSAKYWGEKAKRRVALKVAESVADHRKRDKVMP